MRRNCGELVEDTDIRLGEGELSWHDANPLSNPSALDARTSDPNCDAVRAMRDALIPLDWFLASLHVSRAGLLSFCVT